MRLEQALPAMRVAEPVLPGVVAGLKSWLSAPIELLLLVVLLSSVIIISSRLLLIVLLKVVLQFVVVLVVVLVGVTVVLSVPWAWLSLLELSPVHRRPLAWCSP